MPLKLQLKFVEIKLNFSQYYKWGQTTNLTLYLKNVSCSSRFIFPQKSAPCLWRINATQTNSIKQSNPERITKGYEKDSYARLLLLKLKNSQ